MTTTDPRADCVAALCKCCDRVVFVCVNEPKVMSRERFRDIGKLVAEGCTIKHVSAEEVRTMPFRCLVSSRK